ncbi:MAG: hypothetical protein HQ491_01675 [Bacteroidetes bacterium]|nr:hypothetical protein [Bacteroidota bacterium]
MPTFIKDFYRISSYLIFSIILLISCKDRTPTGLGKAAIPADKALATFTVADGFKIEMIASEPLITDPVDMEID